MPFPVYSICLQIRRLTPTRAIRVARKNVVAHPEEGDTQSTEIAPSWPSDIIKSVALCRRLVHHRVYKNCKKAA